MRTTISCLALLALGAIGSERSAVAATFQLVGSDPVPILITGPIFLFDANANGGGIFEFQNATGNVLTSLTFQASIPNPGCPQAPAFTVTSLGVTGLINTGFNYSVTSGCPGDQTDFFQLVISGTHLENGTGVFTVNLNDPGDLDNYNNPDGSGGWDGARFSNSSTDETPEPASMMLVGAGLVGLATWHRRRQRRT